MEIKAMGLLCWLLISVGLVTAQNSTEGSTSTQAATTSTQASANNASTAAATTTAKPVVPTTQAPGSTQAPAQPTTAPTTPPPDKGRLIKCYSCINCAEPFNSTAKGVEVKSCYGKCEKNYRSASTSSVNGTRVDRACDAKATDVVCPPPISLFGWTTVDCYCSTDLCNGGTRATGLGLMVVVAVHFLYRFLTTIL